MPGFESIIDQRQPLEILTTFIRQGNIPHALLFYGVNGVGKRAAAKLFSMALNCLGQRSGLRQTDLLCGFCRSCGKIESGNHPDVITIKPSGAFIRIAQIRELLETLSLKPYEAKTRVVVISDAHAMNPEAANALLKMLEEPPDHTIFVLTTEQLFDLLPTVVSRCQQIRFKPISCENLKQLLMDKHSLAPDAAHLIAAMANGSLTKAVQMSQSNWIIKRNWLIGEMESLTTKPIGLLMIFAEKLSKDKVALMDALDIMMTWLRDVLIYKFSPQKIMNTDLARRIQYASEHFSTDSLLLKIKHLQQSQRDIRGNANLRVTLDALVVRLAQI